MTTTQQVKELRMHHFHTDKPVLSITAAAVNLRNSRYVEIHGYGEARCRIRIGENDEANQWLQVYELLCARNERETGRPRSEWSNHFYLVEDEFGKISCGMIQVIDGDICLVG